MVEVRGVEPEGNIGGLRLFGFDAGCEAVAEANPPQDAPTKTGFKTLGKKGVFGVFRGGCGVVRNVTVFVRETKTENHTPEKRVPANASGGEIAFRPKTDGGKTRGFPGVVRG